MLQGTFMRNLEPSGEVMYIYVESHNGILESKDNGPKVDWMERHHIKT